MTRVNFLLSETMVFETSITKSATQQAIEAILEQPAARGDVFARTQRAKAAMVLECVRHGYVFAKIAHVAKRAQISTATIYRDFGDRDTLLVEALKLVVGVFAQNWARDIPETDPVKRMELLLRLHGDSLADPFMAWIFRLYVHLANTSAPQLLALARAARDANQAFWLQEIANLEAHGHLVATDHKIVVAILLGAVERRTILSRLAFGENDIHEPDLASVAHHMAQGVFQVFGTRAFWTSRFDIPANGWIGDEKVDHSQKLAQPIFLLDPPSQRLRAFASRVMARDIHRLNADNRKVRIQLAAMLECMEMGYEAATIAGVAVRAGVSTATFYTEYPDKHALFIDAMVPQTRFFVDYHSLIDPNAPPAVTIANIVYSISQVLADPDFLWFHHVSMASEISNSPLLIESSRATRAHAEGFWLDYLTSLEVEGLIGPNDKALTMNALLGATQRRSVLAMVFFGADDVSPSELCALALASTDFVLRLVGSKTVWRYETA